MADTSGKPELQEPSMEDILASIRRILTEDGSAAPAEAEPAAAAVARPMAPPLAPGPEADADDEPEPERAESPAAPQSPPASTAALAESLFDDPAPVYTPPPRRPAPPIDDVFVLSPDMRAGGHKLVSQQAAVESTDVLSQLARAILDRRDMHVASRNVTLEDMVREMLRPLLREWLDRNLPYLTERLVKKEIDLMINRAERLED
ncbi:MAG TPA: DUF2497 domain-containing protein [Rhodospirillales bacterium]|nr:DUF2497 domain-containing protein [Rhodospirillales bacterium]